MRTQSPRRAAVPAGLLLLAALACAESGTWKDDPANWGRAFHSTPPEGVVVTHSRYWRSPHWTLEFEYYFAIEPHGGLRDQLFRENKLRRVEGAEAARAKADAFGQAPEWFAPEAADGYEVWVLADQPGRNFKLLIDRDSGALFLADYQV